MSSHRYTGIPLTLSTVVSDDVAVFRCAWRSRGWYCDGKVWCRCTVFRSEEFDAWYPDWRRRSSTGCGAPHDTDCKALDHKQVVGIENCQLKNTSADTEGECTPHWSCLDWGWVSKTKGPGGEISFMWCFRRMKGSSMVACMFFVSIGRHRGSQWRVSTMVRWMATWYLGGFIHFPMAERDISANSCRQMCEVSRTWWRWPIKRATLSGTREIWKCSPQYTSSTKSSAILSSSWLSSSFEVVANQVFCKSCGYIPPVCRNGQWWTDINAALIPGFTQSLCICNHTKSGRDRPQSYCSKPWGNNSEVLAIERAAAGICTNCPVRAKQSTRHMVTEYRSWWLW